MFLILFGAPGVGKGTQAEKICAEYNIPQISTGEMLRAAIKEGTDLGKKAKILMDKGQLVPDDVIMGIIDERIKNDDCKNGFILDGFPRTIRQAEEFTAMLEKHDIPEFTCVEIYVPNEAILERLLARGREDDSKETILNRLEVYQAQTAPVKEYYQKARKFFSVDGNKSIDEVFNEIKNLAIN
ncbi:MAG: adenylate kinase [Calditrichaeota bacterium]|nr:MAG: adenylate kinase [Calditrichota bacterium]MBL1204306.1 adenylate kinase [Calditrichota bacterium]NOG44136.1 adenylate kinase [Calditrichota bacterium]